MKVFVVEDSDAICERIVQMLNDVNDARVVGTADKVSTALLGIKKYQPDVVILDIQLLDGNGLTVFGFRFHFTLPSSLCRSSLSLNIVLRNNPAGAL